jgi:hypothetical protein
MVLNGKLLFAAYRKSDRYIDPDSIRSSRMEVVEYLTEQHGPEYAAEYGYRPHRVLIIPVDFGQT